jgi:uncharacterized membrane protein YeaQ/YmgE (transglycosylase-associated protein family)
MNHRATVRQKQRRATWPSAAVNRNRNWKPQVLSLPEEEKKMFLNLIVFAVIGLFAGAAARLFYPGRQPGRILGTMVLGMVGSLLGGLLSWAFWPEVNGQFDAGALLLSILGAVFVLVLWASVAYARRLA